jgi:integrase
MGSKIYKRGKTWWAYWTDDRGDHRQSLKTSDRIVAAERLRRVELAATNPAAHSGITLAQAITAMFAGRPTMPAGTRHAYSKQARSLARVIGADTALVDVTRERILDFIATRSKQSISKATIGKELMVLRLGMTEAINRGLFDGDIKSIVPKVKSESKPRHRWLEQWEVQGVIDELHSAERRLWFVTAVYTGMRLSELGRFAWSDIDWARGAIRVRGTKTRGSNRTIPLAAPLAELLDGTPVKAGKVLAPWCSLHRDLTAALRRAKLAHAGHGTLQDIAVERISPNDLRRTFCSWLCQGGTTEAVAARLLGHSSSSMVRSVYGHYAAHNYADAVAGLPVLCTAGVRPKSKTGAKQAQLANRKTA